MKDQLALEDNRAFYNIPFPSIKPADNRIYYGNKVEVFQKEFKGPSGFETKYVYKKKYNEYSYHRHDAYVKVDTFRWNKKFKNPVHKLAIMSGLLQEIKYLPKELLVLYIEYSKPLFMMNKSVLPKGIVSISINRTERFPLDGVDLTKFNKLKVLNAYRGAALAIPKLPKSIEYVNFEDSMIGNGMGPGLKKFNLKDYPNLKYLNVRGTGIKRKDIPKELLAAKKSKKIQFYY